MKNEKGFVLIETLIAAVAVMGIFSLLYANYYPLMKKEKSMMTLMPNTLLIGPEKY